jgi:hypothetical protein
MTLDEDLNKICKAKHLHKPEEVSQRICSQVEIIEGYPIAKVGKATALELQKWLKWRSEYKESYPYIERAVGRYLSLHGYIARFFKR